MKKITGIIFISLIILCNPTFCQSWQKYDSLRNVYQEKKSYDTALLFADKALQVVADNNGENDTIYANLLHSKADVYSQSNNYNKAIEFLEIERNLRSKIQGTNSIEYTYLLTNLAETYMILGNYPKAISLASEIVRIRKQILGKNNLLYANAISNLGTLYNDIGNNSQAESLYKEAIEINKNIGTDNQADYANTLNNLANLYVDFGNYVKAEPLYMQAIDIDKVVFGLTHPESAVTLSNLASMYYYMGNYPKAEELFKETSDIFRENNGEKDPNYLMSLNNLGLLYTDKGINAFTPEIVDENFVKAETLIIKAVNLTKEILGEKTRDYANSLNNLAILYDDIGKSTSKKEDAVEKFAMAEPLYIQSAEIYKEVSGEKDLYYAIELNNLAKLYEDMGNYSSDKELAQANYSKSETLFLRSMEIYKELFGNIYPDYATSLMNLAKLYTDIGNLFPNSEFESTNLAKAEPLFIEAIDVNNFNIQQNFTILSEKEKELYYKTRVDAFNRFVCFTLKRKYRDPDLVKNIYNYILTNKGLFLKSSTAMRLSILNSRDTILIAKYKTWLDLKKTISDLNLQEVSARKDNPDKLEEKANNLEKELVRKSQIFNDFKKLKSLSWKDVRNNLQPNEAAIEFLRFTINKDSVGYCALILGYKSKLPEMIKLFDEKDLIKILGTEQSNDFSYIQKIYGTNDNSNEQLYRLIWQPLENYLEGVKTIYFSPDGLLHKISFSALSKGKNIYLCNTYKLFQLSSTGKVAMPEAFIFNNHLLAGVYGGIEYSTDTTSQIIWNYLPGTKAEADNVNRLLNSQNIKTNYLSGTKAGEKEFKERSSGFDIIHIATHGFSFPAPDKEIKEKKVEASTTDFVFRGGSSGFGVWQFVKNKNPMMRSGLVLAGANNVWNQKYASNEEDGVLTAQEISQLNLQRTQLVVLSACESGLGDIKGSEGVYGLQRAFKMAGAKFIIMSLWQVPDKETVEFMETFYTKLLKIKEIKMAFSETQKEMRQKYDPYFWAAFVLIE